MDVLIYDPLHAGHHLHWVRLLASACAPLARRVTLATSRQAAASPEFAEHLGGLAAARAGLVVDDTVEPPGPPDSFLRKLAGARRAWDGLTAAVARHRPGHVFLPFGDNLVGAALTTLPGWLDLGLPPSHVDALFLQVGEFAYAPLPWKRRLRGSLVPHGLARLPFGRLLFIDQIAYDWLALHRPALARRCALAPDPVSPVRRHSKADARAALNLPTDGRLISCVGALDARKGADELVRTFAAAPLKDEDRLLLAGRAAPRVREAVREVVRGLGPGRVFSIDRLLSADELDLAVSAADVVAVTYRFPQHIGSASILIRAAAAGRPVLASERGWPGHVTRELSLGWIYPAEPAGRGRAIAEALGASAGYQPGEAARRFVEFHSVRSFAELMTAPLRERLGAGLGAAAADRGCCRTGGDLDVARVAAGRGEPGRRDGTNVGICLGSDHG